MGIDGDLHDILLVLEWPPQPWIVPSSGLEWDEAGHSRPSIAPHEAMLYRADPVQQSIAKPPRRSWVRRRLRGGSKGYLSA